MRIVMASVALCAMVTAAYAQDVTLPDYYPADYMDMVEASKNESGHLVIYSNLAEFNWAPAIAGFEEQYPWISVETLDLSSTEVHTRWIAEASSSATTGDVLVSSAHDRWALHGLDQDLEPYESPELPYLPEFARQTPGIFVLAADPMVIAYNTALLSEEEQPTGFASMIELYKSDPGRFGGALGTLDPARSALGLSIWYSLLGHWGETAWADIETIGPDIRGETSGGAINEKVATGEYALALYVTGTTIFPLMEQPGGDVLGYTFPDDGTPISLRGMGIPPNGANQNSARLFVDFMLSQRGQTLLGQGGLTVYRDDVDEADVPFFTYQEIAELAGGEENLVIAGFNQGLLTEAEAFISRWTETVKPR